MGGEIGSGARGGEAGGDDAGASASGGRAAGSGGVPAGTGGGGQASGGATATGGAAATGGANGTGGAAATGGANGMGGASGMGGAGIGGRGSGGAGSGGAAATGGANSTGGASGMGGAGIGGRGSGGAGSGGAGTGGAGSGGATSPRILSIDFVGGRATAGAGGTVSIPMGPDETAGVKPAKNWNSAAGAAGSLATLLLADGSVATGAKATWSAPLGGSPPGIFGLGYTDMPGDVRMMNGCLNPAWSSAPTSPVSVLSVSGLPSSMTAAGYDVYVYVLGGIPSETRAYEYTIGSTTIKVSQVGPTPAASTPYVYMLAPGGGSGSYIVFKKLTAAAFELLVKSGSQSSNQYRAPINGVQIVAPSGT